ncbi:MAG: hypothetical protein IJL26_07705 [Clostridia bacterium]|nr:hypothetical protein [Clostridia bacterium]
MKKHLARICAVVMLLTLVLSMAACKTAGSDDNIVRITLIYDENSPYKPVNGGSVINGGSNGGGSVTPAPTNNGGGSDSTTAPTTTPTTASNGGGNDTPAPSSDAPTEAPAADTLPSDPAGILAKYKEVMDNTKATIKTYDKFDYIEITEFDVGSASGIIRPIVEGLITSKDKAEVQHRDDHKQIPPVNDVGVGCGLTNAGAIKSASCVDNGDGTATIKITLNDEVNPEPMDEATGVSSSNVGGIFACMSKSATEKTIMENIGKVPGGQLNSIDLTYKDCTVEMTFDKAANHATKINYTTPGHAAASVKVVFNINANVCLENHVEISNMVY